MTQTEAEPRHEGTSEEVAGAMGADVPAEPGAIGVLRRTLGEFARRHGAGPRLAERMELAVSEAVTNVVRHAYAAGEPGGVSFAADAEERDLQVVVSDCGRGLHEDASHGAGLGLRIIATVSDDFAVSARPEGGLEVWMRFLR
jgi:anti-sigma regulatory factor (Ser/Thr protein kinase)